MKIKIQLPSGKRSTVKRHDILFRSMLFTTIFLGMTIVFTGCLSPMFLPVPHHTPVLKDKGEFAGSLGTELTKGLSPNANLAYSPVRHLLIHGAYKGYFSDSGKSGSAFNQFNYLEAAIGGYASVNKRLYVQLLAGYGASRMNWKYPSIGGSLSLFPFINEQHRYWGQNSANRTFAQINAGIKFSEVAKWGIFLGFRVARLRFMDWDYQEWHSGNPDGGRLFGYDGRRESTPRPGNAFTQLEPSLTFHFGWKRLEFFQQVMFTFAQPYQVKILDNSGTLYSGLTYYLGRKSPQ